MASIKVNGEDFFYEALPLSYEDNIVISHDEARDTLFKIRELFEEKDLLCSLAFGTLLGAIREHDFIKGDSDVDVFTNNETKLISILPFLRENGVELIRVTPRNTYSFRYKEGCYIDVYILRPLPRLSIWSLYCYALDNHATPKKFFQEYERILFLGKEFLCPKNPEKLVEFWYGKKWRTPVSGHNYYYEVRSAYYWHCYISPKLQKLLAFSKWRKYFGL